MFKLGMFNQVLKDKWLWRFADERDNLWRKVIGMKYGQGRGGVGAVLTSSVGLQKFI